MIKLLIVDDSALFRKMLKKALAAYKDIHVVGTAMDPYIARNKILQLEPDVLTLDLAMPKMDGLSFLAKLMKHHPMPVIVVSAIATKNSEAYMEAFQLGAVDVFCKPETGEPDIRKLVRMIRAAAVSRVDRNPPEKAFVPDTVVSKIHHPASQEKIIAIGASTGGTQALETILVAMPENCPGIVAVQHMPAQFTFTFANRLNSKCRIRVKEAVNGELIRPGQALIAPGDRHMRVEWTEGGYRVLVRHGPKVHFQRPSVDVLFRSVAACAGADATGILLTGMGHDGAQGLLLIRNNQGFTVVQDENTCVVFGMPREAIKIGAALHVSPLDKIPELVLANLN